MKGGVSGFDYEETKLPTYWTTPFTKLCLGMRVSGQTKFLVINQKASSLFSLIADDQYRPTSLQRDAWKSLISGSSLQRNCNREGFNANVGSLGCNARIGITSNNEGDCNTNDSRIGFGTGGHPDNSNTCGFIARHGGDNGDKDAKAIGYILVMWSQLLCVPRFGVHFKMLCSYCCDVFRRRIERGTNSVLKHCEIMKHGTD